MGVTVIGFVASGIEVTVIGAVTSGTETFVIEAVISGMVVSVAGGREGSGVAVAPAVLLITSVCFGEQAENRVNRIMICIKNRIFCFIKASG
jgi:hypothetical protein